MMKWIAGLVVFAVGFFGAIVFWGIYDGISTPLRRDYELRKQVVDALHAARPAQSAIAAFYATNGVMCSTKDTCGIGDLDGEHHALHIGSRGSIALLMRAPGTPLDGSTIMLRPHDDGTSLVWDCKGGNMRAVYRPSSCRGRREP